VQSWTVVIQAVNEQMKIGAAVTAT